MEVSSASGPGQKAYRNGTHRSVAPADTLARIEPLKSRFGITRIANLTGLDRTGIPVVMVCRPNARSSAVFHGKGLDLAAARASGVMEAIETWHAEQAQLPLRFGSRDELRETLPIADVESLPRLRGKCFDHSLPMLWVEGRNMIDGGALWVPFEIVHADSRIGGPPATGCFAASTNGLASGNHPLEAASHALCELIERDATSLWRDSPPDVQDRSRLDLATIDDGTCLELLDRFAEGNIDVAVWDIATEIGVPAFLCQVMDRNGEIGHVGIGAGCHPTRQIALVRALTEAAQVRTTYIAGSREDIDRADYHPEVLAHRNARARALARPTDHARSFRSAEYVEFDTFEEEIEWLLGRLRSAGIRQVVAIDLMRPELGLAVVRVIVPGLEGSDHHPGYTPGRRALARQARRA